jgi:hypothetical protein
MQQPPKRKNSVRLNYERFLFIAHFAAQGKAFPGRDPEKIGKG